MLNRFRKNKNLLMWIEAAGETPGAEGVMLNWSEGHLSFLASELPIKDEVLERLPAALFRIFLIGRFSFLVEMSDEVQTALRLPRNHRLGTKYYPPDFTFPVPEDVTSEVYLLRYEAGYAHLPCRCVTSGGRNEPDGYMRGVIELKDPHGVPEYLGAEPTPQDIVAAAAAIKPDEIMYLLAMARLEDVTPGEMHTISQVAREINRKFKQARDEDCFRRASARLSKKTKLIETKKSPDGGGRLTAIGKQMVAWLKQTGNTGTGG